MYSQYPYDFEFQPQVHLRTDYPPRHSYPHSQYQDQQTPQEIQIRSQNQQPRSAQPNHYQFVSTPNTTIDTPTPGYMTCPTTTTVTSSMSYFAPSPQQELVFADPLIRPHGSDASDANVNSDMTPMESHYSCDYDYEWGMEQSTSPDSSQAPEQRQQLQHIQSYPLPSQQQTLSVPLTYSPPQSISSKPHIQIPQPHSQIHSPCEPSSPMTQVPPPRLTRPVRREREQPFKAFHPYANARPTVTVGEREKEKRREDSPINRDEIPAGSSSPVSSANPPLTSTIPSSSPSTPLSVSTPVSSLSAPAPPSPTKTQTQSQKPNKSLNSITIPDPGPTHITTPTPIIGLFGSYPLSRGQALPGPTCAPETSSSVMRLVIAPGALTPNGVAPGRSAGKKEKSEKAINVAAAAAAAAVAVSSSGSNSTMLATSVNMTTMNMSPSLDFSNPTATQVTPSNASSTSTFSVVTANAGQNVSGAVASSSSSSTTSVLNNFNTPTPGLSAAPSSNPNAIAMRKPRMACYFCRKRKIACGPGPEAIARAQEAQAQQLAATTTATSTTSLQLDQGQGQGQGEPLSETNSAEDSGSKLSSTLEGGNNNDSTSPTSPSVTTPPVLLSSPSLQTLTGDEGPCNQCARRGLACDRPTESKRGVRKGKSKKEKEKEAREKEAKEKELAKKGGDTEKSKKDGNKDQSDDEGGMDDDDGGDGDDVDMDGSGEVDPEERDDGDEGGNDEAVSPTVAVSTDPIPLRPLLSPATTTSNNSSSMTSGPSSAPIVIAKPPNRGRGRPPKHLTYANLNPSLAPASSAVTISKGGMKSMTSSFKWTSSATADNNKAKSQARGKGKGKGKKKDVSDVGSEDVVLSVQAAVVVVKNEDNHRAESRVEDMPAEIDNEQRPQLDSECYEGERSGDLESDEDMEETVQQTHNGDEDIVNGPRDDGGSMGSAIDSDGSMSSLTPTPTIMNSEVPAPEAQLEVQHPPSFPAESSLSPLLPGALHNPTNTMSLSPNGTYPTSISPYDSYGYAHGHLHSPVAVEQPHTQHSYPTPDESLKSSDDIHSHSTTPTYTNTDVTMLQDGNGAEAYHSSQVSPVFNSHDSTYVMDYPSNMMEQAHGSMAIAHSNLGSTPIDMHAYYSSGVQSVVAAEPYHMCVEYGPESGSYDVELHQQQQQRHQVHHQLAVSLNAEPYEQHAVNGYATGPMSGMGYDHASAQTQAYLHPISENDYASYGYVYGYNGEYAP